MGSRVRLSGPAQIHAALDRGDRVRLVMLLVDAQDPEAVAVADRARAAGVEVRVSGPGVLRRFTATGPAAQVLALVGPDPAGSLEDVLAERGAVWVLAGVRYPGNLGFAIRTAEVSGAAGVVVDAPQRDRKFRLSSLRASMHAERLVPVLWEDAGAALDLAKAAGHRVVGIEDVGDRTPWEVDLAGPCAFVVGGERDGIAEDVLARCDEIVRVPMSGFIPSYNLQAAMSVVVGERLRQVARE